MSGNKTKLELTWIGKDQRPKLEPRILLEDSALSYAAKQRVAEEDIFDNLLIQGDNLLALKALEQEYAGKVKCIFIDPPYNTGSAFEHYDDGVEHSIWLSLIRERLELLWKLLTIDGSLWITIDDHEMPYLRVLAEEMFGRSSFVAQCIWQKRYSRDNNSAIGDVHDYVICFAKDADRFKAVRNRVALDQTTRSAYRNPNNDPRGPWRLIPMNGAGTRKNQQYPVTTPSGKIIHPPEGRHWATLEPKFLQLVAEGKVFFGKNGDSQPGLIRYLSEVEGLVPWTWWPHEEVGHNDEAKKEIQDLFGKANVFDTPKPERLLQRILHIATNPADLVLDSFGGSGTTGAVAHKMGRRWIMVELGDHAVTHIVPRLHKVIDNQDPGGVTEAAGWKGGGGFRFYRLAPSFLEKDKWGNWVVSKKYNAAQLAEAVCKLHGFRYEPSPDIFWQQGRSTETDFLYVTTQTLLQEQLATLSTEVGPQRTLLVVCAAYRGKPDNFDNLTVKKIPASVLASCEWGRDDYSLNVANVLREEPKSTEEPPARPAKPGKSKVAPGQVDLFGQGGKK